MAHSRTRRAALLAIVGLAVFAAAVLVARWFRQSQAGLDFLASYPGFAPQPTATPQGIPAWLNWQHYLNLVFMLLIVRSALVLRSKQRPPAFFTRRNEGLIRTSSAPRRMSIYLWLHLSADLLWVPNGIVYIVLLVGTGHWMRIVPTTWAVVPNAVSAGIQYLSFQWPTEHAWAAYNALQQLSYFAVVFLAAPLALGTGLRLSAAWPATWSMNRFLPEKPARKIHAAVLWFFVGFIVVHVTLVLTNGPLSNLNAMFAANDGTSLLGLGMFLLAVLSVVFLWVAVRPGVLKAVAARFGKVQ